MNIRPARLADCADVYSMAKTMATSFDVEASAFERAFLHHLDNEASAVLVAEIDGILISYCLGYDHYAFYANGLISWLEEIYVLDAHQQQGVGQQMMAAFERWALARGSKLISLATRRAQGFYNAIGYQESAIYFRKVL